MLNLRVEASTWLLGIFMMLSCVSAATMEVVKHTSTIPLPPRSTPVTTTSNALSTSKSQWAPHRTSATSSSSTFTASDPWRFVPLVAGFIAEWDSFVLESEAAATRSTKRSSKVIEWPQSQCCFTSWIASSTWIMSTTNWQWRQDDAPGVHSGGRIERYVDLSRGVVSLRESDSGWCEMASAHGTGYQTASSLGDIVRKLKWVNAKGEIIVSDLHTELGANEVRALLED